MLLSLTILVTSQTSFGYNYFPSDVSLTLPNVLAAVRTVQKLGDYVIEVPDTKVEEVRQQSASDEERREGLVRYFLHAHPNASWEWLGGELLRCEEDAAVQNVKVHIKLYEGMY